MKLLSIASTIICTFQLASADWQYRSRPDLAPPRLNITISAEGTSPGYLFVAPFSGFPDVGNLHGPRQAAPYIFTDKGELVWSGFSYFSIWATNFQAGRVNGENVLFSFEGSHNPGYGHGHGHITFLDENYETVKELRAGNHKIIDKHEFHIIDEKTGLVQIYQPVPYDLSPYGASKKQQWVVNAIFQELDIETGKVLFEWSSLDHVSPYESVLPINEGQAGAGFNSSDAWDYFHINSVDKDKEGNYLLSARDAAALYKIDGKTGEVIWKLGGLPGITTSDFKSEKNLTVHRAGRLSKSIQKTRKRPFCSMVLRPMACWQSHKVQLRFCPTVMCSLTGAQKELLLNLTLKRTLSFMHLLIQALWVNTLKTIGHSSSIGLELLMRALPWLHMLPMEVRISM